MILADKIIEERKKLGLSQEELADKLCVSRQAVSKWESAQSIPDLQKIIAMSELFSVSTDYLLKDDAVRNPAKEDGATDDKTKRRVSMEEANDYLKMMKTQSKGIALGVMMCILCPVLLIFLCGLAEGGIGGISQTAACVIGMVALFGFIAAAIFIFIMHASKTEKYVYLEKQVFETAYGVSGLVKEKKNDYQSTYTKFMALGIILCVLSPLPLIVAASINLSNVLIISMTALLLCIVAVGVYLIVRVAMVKSSFDILLQEGDYNKADKKKSGTVDAASGIYWCLATAIFLGWSFITNKWNMSWVVWPIAGVLFAPFIMIVKLISGGDNK